MTSPTRDPSLTIEGTSSRSHWMPWLPLILGLGLALRLYGLARFSLWYDEATTVTLQKYLARPWLYFDSAYGNEPPLLCFIMSAWYRFVFDVLGADRGTVLADYLIRLFPAIVSTFAIALTFFFARALTSATRPALCAAFLLAISPFQVHYAQEYRAYALHVVLSIITVWAMHRALETGKGGLWAGFVLASVGGIYNHFFMVWNVVVFNFYVLLCARAYWKRSGAWIISNLLIIYLSVPALTKAFYTSSVFEVGKEAWFPKPDFRLGLITIKSFFAGYSPNADIYKILGGLGLLLAAGGCLALRKKPKVLVLLLTLTFAPLAINILYWQTKDFPYYTHRLMIFSAVPLYVLVGHGIAALRSKKAMAVCLAAFAALTLFPLTDHYRQRLHPSWDHMVAARHKADTRGAASFVKERMRGGDRIVHRANYTVPSFEHYLLSPQVPVEFTVRDVWRSLQGYPDIAAYESSGNISRQLDQTLQGAARAWFVGSSWERFNVGPVVGAVMARWLDLHAVRVLRKPFDGLTLYLYDFELADEPRFDQVADTGAVQALRYHTPTPARLHEEALVRFQYLLADLSRPVQGWGVRFETSLLVASDAPIDNLLGRPAFEDHNGDGVIDSVGFEQSGKILDVGDSLDINGITRSLIALDSAEGRALFASYPQAATQVSTYRFAVENASANPRDLRLRIIESAEVLEAMSFSLAHSGSSVWRPEFQYNQHEAPLAWNRFAFVATLGEASPDGASIHRDFLLEPGTYRGYVRCAVQGGGINRHGAQASLFLGDALQPGDRELLSVITPVDEATANGWRWLPAGTFSATGATQRLTVAVHNRDHLAMAQFQLDRVVFVHQKSGDSSGSIQIKEKALRIPPHFTQIVEERSGIGAAAQKRIDIELSDAGEPSFRDLHFYMRRPRPPLSSH